MRIADEHTLDACIEKYAYVPCNDGRPLLAVHMQYDKVLNERFAMFPLETSLTMPRLANENAGQAMENGMREIIGKKPHDIPMDIYRLHLVQKNGLYIPHVSLSAVEIAKVAVRFKYTVWESGGKQPGYNGIGAAQIITNRAGAKMHPAIVRQSGHLANGRHAAFSIYPETNLVIVQAFIQHDQQTARIGEIRWEHTITVPTVVPLWEGSDHHAAPNPFYDAVCAVLDKANTVNCEQPMFISAKRNYSMNGR